MNVLRRIAMAISGTVVVALVLTLAVPRAAHAVLSALVTITNTASNPVPVRATDNPGLNSFLVTLCVADQSGAEGNCNLPDFPSFINTPATSRFVIQYVEGSCQVSGSAQSLVGPMEIDITPRPSGVPVVLSFHLNFDRFDSALTPATTFLSFQQATNIYVDPNSLIAVGLDEVVSNRPAVSCLLHMSGHTVAQ